ncbi:MAG: glutamine-hydrolyzing carbamoyl-phosphate synthase small subunit [Deltaproteobacteria bacterium]|nr:glutamine-hydrolyzing carbamoyl-phosphate synthase small subunit [Deltaproteobacteria bacterium]
MRDKVSSSVPAHLALADGTVFKGRAIGQIGEATGEVVFNTSMYGYQEIITDPSYVNQMVTFTYPHIGNVGVNAEDVESARVQVAGIIVHELSACYSNFRAQGSLEEYLKANGVVGIAGIDTRSLVLHIRNVGAQMGVIASGEHNPDELVDRARALPSLEGLNLAERVSASAAYDWTQGTWVLGRGYKQHTTSELSKRPLVVVLDYGVKYNILRLLIDSGFRVRVLPVDSLAKDVLALSPDGVFLSNGPGDPAAVVAAIECVRELLGKKPIFGICLGHQILGLALGLKTYKLKFGHRGGNHPVRNKITGLVEITSQNHGFACVPDDKLASVKVSHVNLNDQTVEGLSVADARAFSVQYHPEASPGPRDSRYLFAQFRKMVEVF